MNTSRTMMIAIVLFAALGLAACEKQGNGATSGDDSSVGKTVDKMSDSVGKAADNTMDATKSAGSAIKDAAQDTGQAISDSALTMKVKTALMADSKLKSLQISVDTTEGVVTLSGEVGSEDEVRAAAQVASGVEGVKGITNNLTVKSDKAS